MPRSKQNLATRAIFAIILSCVTVSLFAQSSTTSEPQDNTTLETDSCGGGPTQSTRIDWPAFNKYDNGYESSVAIHPSGLIVEVHSSGQTIATYTGLYYRIGKLDAVKGAVSWGPSRRWVSSGTSGSWPSVAITKEGYAILTYSNAFTKSNAGLRYYVGTLDLDGTTDQQINFKVSNTKYDNGFHNSISVNYNGTIAEAHEADGGKGIYYRLGHLNGPGSGDFSIVWDTGSNGQKYDNGINPRISINDNNDVVEVHQVTGEHLLHYIRGKASANQIAFSSNHPRYSDNGDRPAVVLLNNGYVVELHGANYNSKTGAWEFFNRVGTLDASHSSLINWSSNTRIAANLGHVGGIATDGNYLIATAAYSTQLFYSWAIAP
jgi:hypothetical protein